MTNSEKQKNGSAEDKEKRKKENNNRYNNTYAFYLVIVMLGIVLISICLLIVLPYYEKSKELLEYYKWSLSVLLGAFGAWIGAGAAYFFGKENLKESSASTEKAMQIQQESFKRPPQIEQIKDLALMGINPNFIFHFSDTKEKVRKKLDENRGYWFVPVVDEASGILRDIIHAQVFWESTVSSTDDKMKLEDLVSHMDKDPSLKKLHGDSFYMKVSPNDKISDVYNLIIRKDAEVVIVADEKGKATHCLTKTELRTFLKVPDNN